ncbi:MAG: large conductance mechanosensitive channel protein MscL [Clostridia bacterium]|nr:large conductance mechanosensitive channel protein MscL [Clostridia bacterium]
MRKIFKEFKDFALRGNVLDLAVGVIIGSAFQNIVKSLTTNIISPILGCFSEVDFSSFSLKIGNLNLTYGAFITDVINFIIMAFIVFLIVKFMNKLANLGKKEAVPVVKEATTKICPHCFSEINIKADRCPFCTSELVIEENESVEQEK